MPLSNAEKQARWRERHLVKRRAAQRIVNLLLRRRLTDEHIEQVAYLLKLFLNREGLRTLRRALRAFEESGKVDAKFWQEQAKQWRDGWLAAHPGRTRAEYDRLVRDTESEVWQWRRAQP